MRYLQQPPGHQPGVTVWSPSGDSPDPVPCPRPGPRAPELAVDVVSTAHMCPPGPRRTMRYRGDTAVQGFVEWFHTRQKTGSRTDRALLGFPSSWWLPGECPLPRRAPRFRAPWTGPENQEWAPSSTRRGSVAFEPGK